MPIDDGAGSDVPRSAPLAAALDLLLDGKRRGYATAIDPERLLVEQGWLGVFCRVVNDAQRVALLVSTREGRAVCRLSRQEYRIFKGAARGLVSKQLACELGVTEGSVRAGLSRLLEKLNLAAGIQLPAVWRALSGGGKRLTIGAERCVFLFSCGLLPREERVTLTVAEREILASLLAGSSNRSISRERGTTERTVANQVAGIFRKFGVSSRRELIVRLLDCDALAMAQSFERAHRERSREGSLVTAAADFVSHVKATQC